MFRRHVAGNDTFRLTDLAFGLLLCAAFLVTDHYPPWTAFHSELMAAGAGAIAVLMGWRSVGRVRPAGGVLLLFALAAVPWLQWAAGLFTFRGDAWVASLYLAGTGMCCWAGQVDRLNDDRLLRNVAVATFAAALLTTAVALYQWLGLRGLNQLYAAEGLAGARPGGNLGQPNHVATLLTLGLAALALARARTIVGSAVGAVLALVLIVGLALTQSRVPWVAAALLMVWVVARRGAPLTALRLSSRAVSLFLVAYGLLFWTAHRLANLVAEGGTHIGEESSRLGVGRRPLLWGQWIEAARQSPWFGYGWQQGHVAQSAGALVRPGLEPSPYAHDVVLDLIAWNGLPLAILCIGVFGWWYWRAARRVEDVPDVFRFAALTVLVAHALVEYPHAYAYFLVPVALLSGGLMETRGHVGGSLLTKAAYATGALAATLSTFVLVRDYLLVEPDIRALREQTARIGGVRMTDPVEGLWMLDQMQAFSHDARIVPRAGMPQAEIDALIGTSRRFPTAGFLQQRALALAANGRNAEATQTMRLLCVLSGQSFHDLVAERLAEIARERLPEAEPFAESLRARRAATPQGMTDNRAATCPMG